MSTSTTKAKPKAKAKSTRKPLPMSVIINTIATKNDEDATKVGKRVRRHLRDHFADVAKEWPALKAKDNRDGNRYPDVPPTVAKNLITRFTR